MTYFANEKNFLDEIISDKIYTDHRYYPVGNSVSYCQNCTPTYCFFGDFPQWTVLL